MQDIDILRLRAKAKMKMQMEREQGTIPTVEEAEHDADTSAIEAGVRSAAQAITFDFADEIEAGIDTAISYVGGKEFTSLEDLSNDYNKNLEESRAEFAQNKLEHPTADTIGTVAGIGASLLIPGGAVAKAGQAAGKGAAALKAAKLGALYGGFGAIGRAEDKVSLKGAIEAAEGAATGAVAGPLFQKGAQALGKGINKLIPKGKKLLNRALKGIGLHNETTRAKFANKLQKKGKDPIEWLKRISNETSANGKDRLVGDIGESFTTIHSKVGNKVKQYGVQRDNILKKVGVKLNREDLAKAIKAQLATSKGSSTQDTAFLNNLVDDIVTLKKGVDSKTGALIKIADDSPLDALSLSSLRKTLDKSIKFDSVSNSNAVKKDLRDVINKITDDLVATQTDDATAAVGKELRGKMSDLYDLQEAVEKGIQREQFGDAAIIQDVISGARGRMMVPGASNTVKDIASAVGIVGRQLSVSPKINRGLSFNMLRLGEAIQNGTESSLRRLFSLADGDDIKAFAEEAAALIATDDLKKMPLPRSVDEAIRRKDTVLAAVQSLSPEMATGLRGAFENGDKAAIGSILNGIANSPISKGLIEEGVGFDGKVYSEEDKAFYTNEIKKAEISLAQKLALMKDLDRTGTIPVIEDDTMPRKQWTPRDRSKQRI